MSGRNRPEQINVGYFDQAAFTNTAVGTRGNAGRNIIRGPGYANTDFMVARIFTVTEKVRFQLRSEFFNLFNRVNLLNPSPNIGDRTTFGRIFGAGEPRILQFGLKLLF